MVAGPLPPDCMLEGMLGGLLLPDRGECSVGCLSGLQLLPTESSRSAISAADGTQGPWLLLKPLLFRKVELVLLRLLR